MLSHIGHGSISAYDSSRYDLVYNSITKTAFFNDGQRQYDINLNEECMIMLAQNMKIWVRLTQRPRYLNGRKTDPPAADEMTFTFLND